VVTIRALEIPAESLIKRLPGKEAPSRMFLSIFPKVQENPKIPGENPRKTAGIVGESYAFPEIGKSEFRAD